MSKQRKLNENLARTFTGIWIPKNIWLSEELTPIQMLVLSQIATLDNDFGCTASNEHIAQFFGVHKDTISDHIQNLQNLNFIICGYENKQGKVGRTIKCTKKYKLLTAGLLDEIDDYKQTLGRNTEGVGETPSPHGGNTDGVITLETSSKSEIGGVDFSDEKTQVQILNQKSIQSNTQKKEKEPSGFSDQCMAAQPEDELQAFEPAEMWRQQINQTCPDMDQLAIETELLNFKTHYSTNHIPANLDKSFQQWCQRSNNTYFKIKKERERIEQASKLAGERINQYDTAKRENIKKIGTNSQSYSKYSKPQTPVDANLKVDYDYCEDNWTNPLLTPKTV